jgi:hypothetical protein
MNYRDVTLGKRKGWKHSTTNDVLKGAKTWIAYLAYIRVRECKVQ